MASVGCPMMTRSIRNIARLQIVTKESALTGPIMFTRYERKVRMARLNMFI